MAAVSRGTPTVAGVPALRSPDRPRLPGRVNGAFGVACDGASATIDPADQPSKAAATKAGTIVRAARSTPARTSGALRGHLPIRVLLHRDGDALTAKFIAVRAKDPELCIEADTGNKRRSTVNLEVSRPRSGRRRVERTIC
jgi:hypothetical protein